MELAVFPQSREDGLELGSMTRLSYSITCFFTPRCRTLFFFFLFLGHHGRGRQPLSLLMNVQNVTVKKRSVCLYFSFSCTPLCAFVKVAASTAED